jgi:hypothetical protein
MNRFSGGARGGGRHARARLSLWRSRGARARGSKACPTGLLDDSSSLIRRALAENFASAASALLKKTKMPAKVEGFTIDLAAFAAEIAAA